MLPFARREPEPAVPGVLAPDRAASVPAPDLDPCADCPRTLLPLAGPAESGRTLTVGEDGELGLRAAAAPLLPGKFMLDLPAAAPVAALRPPAAGAVFAAERSISRTAASLARDLAAAEAAVGVPSPPAPPLLAAARGDATSTPAIDAVPG